MMYCIVCGGRTNGCLCPRCGFDLSQCRESYPTLSADCPERRALWTLRDEMFRRQQSQESAVEPRSKLISDRRTAKKAEEPLPPDAFQILAAGNGTCTITGLTGNCPGTLDVPRQIRGLRVTQIAARALMGRYDLISVLLPDSILTVGTYAFYGCKSLQKLRLPQEVELKAKAFGNCPSLVNVVFDSSSRKAQPKGRIAEDAFSAHCQNLTFFAAPESTAAEYAAQSGIKLDQTRSEA